MSNIRPFREEPNWVNKALIALAYVLLSWIVTTQAVQTMGNLLSLFMLIGILLWVLVVRQRSIKYFVRYHLTQAVLLNMTLAAILWLLTALLGLMLTVPGLNILGGILSQTLFSDMPIGNLFYASPKNIVVMTVGFVMALYAIRGRYTELPWITDGVRYWV